MARPSPFVAPDDDRTTEASATDALHLRILPVVVRALEGALALLFLYLGSTKLLGYAEAKHFAAIGVNPTLIFLVGTLELVVSVLFFIHAAGGVLNALIVVVALVELLVLKRPPIAVIACVGTHGLTTWARSAQEKRRDARDAKMPDPRAR